MSKKIDIHKTQETYTKSIEYLEKDEKIIPENKTFILNFLRDCKLGKTIKNREKKKIGPARLVRYIVILRFWSYQFGKPFDKVTQKDMEEVIMDLEDDKILKKNNNMPYSDESKVTFKKAIKKFYKWLQGNNTTYPELVNWIDTSSKPKEIRALSKDEIIKMVSSTNNIQHKCMIMLLFDSGARIEEFLNIRIQNLTKCDDYYKIRIEHSKTKPRTVSVPMSTKYIEDWLAMYEGSDNPSSQLMPYKYDGLRFILGRIGKKAIKKRVTPHILRHSSATYYCPLLKQYQLCYRYGWSMASDMPARYIDVLGLSDEKTAEFVKHNTMNELKNANDKLREEQIFLKEEINNMKNNIKSEVENLFKTELAKLNLPRYTSSNA